MVKSVKMKKLEGEGEGEGVKYCSYTINDLSNFIVKIIQ